MSIISKNKPCPCQSGKKFKRCCGNESEGIYDMPLEYIEEMQNFGLSYNFSGDSDEETQFTQHIQCNNCGTASRYFSDLAISKLSSKQLCAKCGTPFFE